MRLATKYWFYAPNLLLELPTRSWCYASNLLLEPPTHSWRYALNLLLELPTHSWWAALNLLVTFNTHFGTSNPCVMIRSELALGTSSTLLMPSSALALGTSKGFQQALGATLWTCFWNCEHTLTLWCYTLRPTGSWCYAPRLFLEPPTLWTCCWKFQHALHATLCTSSWNFQHSADSTHLISRTWQKRFDIDLQILLICVHVVNRSTNMPKFPRPLTMSWPWFRGFAWRPPLFATGLDLKTLPSPWPALPGPCPPFLPHLIRHRGYGQDGIYSEHALPYVYFKNHAPRLILSISAVLAVLHVKRMNKQSQTWCLNNLN